MAEKKTITVFGGTGFIGRNLIGKLAKKGFKIIVPTRNPYLHGYLKPMGEPGQIEVLKFNFFDFSNLNEFIKYKTSINKIKASTLKELGFKSKTIAKNFAKLTDVNPKEYSNEELLLTALKNKLSMFQKLGLEFNFIKSFDYSSPK